MSSNVKQTSKEKKNKAKLKQIDLFGESRIEAAEKTAIKTEDLKRISRK